MNEGKVNWEKVAEALSLEMEDDHRRMAAMKEKIDHLTDQNHRLVERLADAVSEGGGEDVADLRIKVLEMENELAVAATLLDEEFENSEAIRTLAAVNAQMYCRAALEIHDPKVLADLYLLSRLGNVSTEGIA